MKKIRRPAVFFDRDGTLIKQVELLHKPSEVKIFKGAPQAVHKVNELGYLAVIITNQPVVARGIIGPREVNAINKKIAAQFLKQGARIDAAYFCPHHPLADMKKFRKDCPSRKPNPGMVLRAANDLNIDLKKSFLVGDSTQDVATANRAKIKMVLVQTGHGGKDPWQHKGKADFKVKNLMMAARTIERNTKEKGTARTQSLKNRKIILRSL